MVPDTTEGLRFTIRHTGDEWDQSIACYWMGTTDKTADAVIQACQRRGGDANALDWLISFLRGDVYTHEIWPVAEEKSISRTALKKAVERHSALFDVTPMGNKSMWKLR